MKTQNEMRSEFEKLEDIASEIENSDGELYFCETEKRYKNHRVFQDAQTGFMNGAWYAFQEQQKKIDTVLNYVSRDGFTPHHVVKELLK